MAGAAYGMARALPRPTGPGGCRSPGASGRLSWLPNVMMGHALAHPSRRAGIRGKDGGIVPVEPKACPSAGSALALAARLAQTHVGVIAWSRTGDPDLGDWGPPEVLVRTGVIPDEFEARGGVE
jgi:hypothetical protein